MPSGFMPVVIDLRPSMKVTIPWDKPKGIQCMPSGFMPVVIDLRPSVKVTIPWGKPKGIQCMPSGFTPVVIDLRPSMPLSNTPSHNHLKQQAVTRRVTLRLCVKITITITAVRRFEHLQNHPRRLKLVRAPLRTICQHGKPMFHNPLDDSQSVFFRLPASCP